MSSLKNFEVGHDTRKWVRVSETQTCQKCDPSKNYKHGNVMCVKNESNKIKIGKIQRRELVIGIAFSTIQNMFLTQEMCLYCQKIFSRPYTRISVPKVAYSTYIVGVGVQCLYQIDMFWMAYTINEISKSISLPQKHHPNNKNKQQLACMQFVKLSMFSFLFLHTSRENWFS